MISGEKNRKMKTFGKVLIIFGGILAACVLLMGLIRHGLGAGSITLLKDAGVVAAAGLGFIILSAVFGALKNIGTGSGGTPRPDPGPSLSQLEARFGKSDMVQDILKSISDSHTYSVDIRDRRIRVNDSSNFEKSKEFDLDHYNYEKMDSRTINQLARYIGSKFSRGCLIEDLTEMTEGASIGPTLSSRAVGGGMSYSAYQSGSVPPHRITVGKTVINRAFEQEHIRSKQAQVKRKL